MCECAGGALAEVGVRMLPVHVTGAFGASQRRSFVDAVSVQVKWTTRIARCVEAGPKSQNAAGAGVQAEPLRRAGCTDGGCRRGRRGDSGAAAVAASTFAGSHPSRCKGTGPDGLRELWGVEEASTHGCQQYRKRGSPNEERRKRGSPG